jgi:hypothetical protein
MKINLIKQSGGRFCPCTDEDMEKFAGLKTGGEYLFEVKKIRNYDFLKKYFALIACTWDCISDEKKRIFPTSGSLRKSLEISAGYFETIYSFEENEYLKIPTSVSFSKMDETEFQELYEAVKEKIFEFLLNDGMNESDFDERLINF